MSDPRNPRPSLPPGANPAPAEQYWPARDYPESEPEQPAVPLTHYLWILKRHRWKIAFFVLASVICAYLISKRLPPIYESTVTVDVDRRMPTGVVGQDANMSAVSDVDQFLATQIK